MRRRTFNRRFDRWLGLSQYGFPFAIGPHSTPVARFRAIARRSRFAGKGRFLRLSAALAMTATWPIGALFTASKIYRRLRRRGGSPRGPRVLLDMYWLALRHSIPPVEYAYYGFNDPQKRRDMHQYVYWNDLPGLAALNAAADNRDVRDKDRFAEICTRHGFAHVPTLAVFDRGKQVRPVGSFVPDGPALWIKPIRLRSSAGAAKWIKSDAFYRNADGHMVPAERIGDELRRQDCLVQPLIENHPVVARISNGALASLRIVTGMNGQGEAEFVTSLIALPHGERLTSAAGILCSIEPQSGRIRKAALYGQTPVDTHPDTGARIADTQLPFWRESVELVRRAHAAGFARFVFLGWDVALTKDGPLLLETNSGWGAIFHQWLDGPLGHTAFARLVDGHV